MVNIILTGNLLSTMYNELCRIFRIFPLKNSHFLLKKRRIINQTSAWTYVRACLLIYDHQSLSFIQYQFQYEYRTFMILLQIAVENGLNFILIVKTNSVFFFILYS